MADAAERSLANSTWRHPNTGGTDYLTLLVAHTGYQLSDIEVTAMKATTPTWTPPAPPRARLAPRRPPSAPGPEPPRPRRPRRPAAGPAARSCRRAAPWPARGRRPTWQVCTDCVLTLANGLPEDLDPGRAEAITDGITPVGRR